MGAKSDHFYLFSAYFGGFSPVLLMEYRIFISIVDISANLKNIDIGKVIFNDINIDTDNELSKNVNNRLLKKSISLLIREGPKKTFPNL